MGTVHAGEREVQLRAGVHERMAAVMGQVVRNAMPEQHIELFEKLPTLMVGGLDAQRRPWATVLTGWPGFMHAPDARHLRIEALPTAADPLTLQLDMPLGLLGLEPHTRRRNRLNGSIVALDSHGYTLQVDQSFGNCPKYIQARIPRWVKRGPQPPAVTEGAQLSDAALRLVNTADTLFIATATPQARGHADAEGVDVSHRGGRPGFVQLSERDGATVLRIPDYRGNNFFNTLGNLAANPRAGLLFIDYQSGDLLQLTGHTEVVWGQAEGQREIHYTVESGLWRAQALPLTWSDAELSPHLMSTPTSD